MKNLNSEEIIAKELRKHFNAIKQGFSFFSINVEQTGDNELSFYGTDNNLLKTQHYKLDSDLKNVDNYRAVTHIHNALGGEYIYDKQCLDNKGQIKHTFEFYPDKDDCDTRYILRLYVSKARNRVQEIELHSYNENDEYGYKEFAVSDNHFKVCIEKAREDEETDQILRTERSLWYATPEYFLWPLFRMHEQYDECSGADYGENNRGISLAGNGAFYFEGETSSTTKKFTSEDAHNIAFAIASHPRNKEVIFYTINEFNKVLPGIKNFVNDNFGLYGELACRVSVTRLSEALVEKVTCKKCDFKKPRKLEFVPQEEQQKEQE